MQNSHIFYYFGLFFILRCTASSKKLRTTALYLPLSTEKIRQHIQIYCTSIQICSSRAFEWIENDGTHYNLLEIWLFFWMWLWSRIPHHMMPRLKVGISYQHWKLFNHLWTCRVFVALRVVNTEDCRKVDKSTTYSLKLYS